MAQTEREQQTRLLNEMNRGIARLQRQVDSCNRSLYEATTRLNTCTYLRDSLEKALQEDRLTIEGAEREGHRLELPPALLVPV